VGSFLNSDSTTAGGRRPALPVIRRVGAAFGLFIIIVVGLVGPGSSPASAKSNVAISRSEAIRQLALTRASVDRTLKLIKEGHATAAFAEARSGYLTQFEKVEIPLRVANNGLTIEAEGRFAEIRQAIRNGDSPASIRDRIIELRRVLDDAERALTDVGVSAPLVVASQSFLIIFREGFEIVLLLAVLLGYLEAARSTRFMRPILVGVAIAAVSTVATVILLQTLLRSLPVPLELIEGITALISVAVLFYVSFWLISRLEHRKWMEFLKARMWNAISVGSFGSLVGVGFTAVYREGFETALFYQSLLSFGSGLTGAIIAGLAAGLVVLAVLSVIVFHLGRKVNVKVFMTTAVCFVMATSVAFLGNAVHALQSADVISYHALARWPKMPIFLAQATGYWATVETILAQIVLATVYIAGAVEMFVLRPRRVRRRIAAAVAYPAGSGSSGTPAAA
jgi:high-affinity iron transporter